jgi:hypothetical protein
MMQPKVRTPGLSIELYTLLQEREMKFKCRARPEYKMLSY